MDTVVVIPYVVLLVLSFVGVPTSPFMIDFAKYLLSFHGFIFLKLCRYFPVIQRLLFTSIKFAKVSTYIFLVLTNRQPISLLFRVFRIRTTARPHDVSHLFREGMEDP